MIPIRVRIEYGLVAKKEGNVAQNIYPDFDQIDDEIRHGMKWEYYLDTYGSGWVYDKVSDVHKTDDYNPEPLVWYAAVLVPEDFAEAAAEMFPDDVTILTEEEFIWFYENRNQANAPEVVIDKTHLEALYYEARFETLLKRDDVSDQMKTRIRNALNPDAGEKGIHRNKLKKWEGFKERKPINPIAHANQIINLKERVSSKVKSKKKNEKPK